MKRRMPLLRGGALLLAAVVVAGACGGASGALPAPAKTKDPLAGEYTAAGANGANPAMAQLVKRFAELHPGVNIKLNDIDTETSVVNVSTGDVDFGYIGRDLRATEKGKVNLSPIGFTGSAVAVNVTNPVTNLTKDQVAKIYTGVVKDWSELGSTAGPIKAFLREPASSTRTSVEMFVFGSTPPKYPTEVVEIFESVDTIKAIGAFKGGFGTVTLSGKNLKDTTIKLLAMDGVAPTLANLNTGAWKIAKPSNMTTAADPAKVKPAIKALVEFVKSPEGQKIISGE